MGILVALVMGVVALQTLFRYRQEGRDGRDGRFAFCHPLANVLVIWILLRSTTKGRYNGKGVHSSMEKQNKSGKDVRKIDVTSCKGCMHVSEVKTCPAQSLIFVAKPSFMQY